MIKITFMLTERLAPPERKEIPRILRIGVDLDDTVTDYGFLYFRAIAIGIGVNIPALYPSFSNRVEELPKIAEVKNSKQFLENLVKREFFYRRAKPIAGAVETLNRWHKEGHLIWFITARDLALARVTFWWQANYGLGWAVERTFLKENPKMSGAEYKNEVCRDLKLDVFIDDMPRYLNAVNAPLKLGLKKPWNTAGYKKRKTGYFLFNNWHQIAEKVNDFLL